MGSCVALSNNYPDRLFIISSPVTLLCTRGRVEPDFEQSMSMHEMTMMRLLFHSKLHQASVSVLGRLILDVMP
jgi:hypothetical protein